MAKVEVNLTPEAVYQYISQVARDGITAPDDFSGPVFEDAELSTSGCSFCITHGEGEVHFPAHAVANVKVTG